MTIAGWIFLLGSWGFIVALALYCFYRVLKEPVKDI